MDERNKEEFCFYIKIIISCVMNFLFVVGLSFLPSFLSFASSFLPYLLASFLPSFQRSSSSSNLNRFSLPFSLSLSLSLWFCFLERRQLFWMIILLNMFSFFASYHFFLMMMMMMIRWGVVVPFVTVYFYQFLDFFCCWSIMCRFNGGIVNWRT